MKQFPGSGLNANRPLAQPSIGCFLDIPPADAKAQYAALQPSDTSSDHSSERLILVHPSRLFRDCLTSVLAARLRCSIVEFPCASDAMADRSCETTTMILCHVSPEAPPTELAHFGTLFKQVGGRAPIVVTGDSEDPALIREFLSTGISGYIPMSLGLEVVLHALLLVKAGGVFAPACCLMNINTTAAPRVNNAGEFDLLTVKQLAVVKAIRQGKPNKMIAYELNMCESTVKVHVRNIMKKLRARNRTQVAFIANQFLEDHHAA